MKKIFLFSLMLLLFPKLGSKRSPNLWAISRAPLNMEYQKAKYFNEKKIWKDFVKAKKKGTFTPIIDYSTAGYDFGESAPPYYTPEEYEYAYSKKQKVGGRTIFNVLDYGATPNDNIDDTKAIKKTMNAANKLGNSVVFFPKGTFTVAKNMITEREDLFHIKAKKVLIKGSGATDDPLTGTIIDYLSGAHYSLGLLTAPALFKIESTHSPPRWSHRIEEIKLTKPVYRGTHKVYVTNPEKLPADDPEKPMVIHLKYTVNIISQDIYYQYYAENQPTKPGFKELIQFNYLYTVEKIDRKKGIIYLKTPLLEDYVDPKTTIRFTSIPRDENGIEDLHIKSYPQKPYVHAPGVAGSEKFKAIKIESHHSWVRNVVVTNAIKGIIIKGNHNSIYNCYTRGKPGHYNYTLASKNHSIINSLNTSVGTTHGLALDGIGSVVYKYRAGDKSGIDAHTRSGVANLIDSSTLGVVDNHGGAYGQYPHHYRFLLFWNIKFRNKVKENFWGKNGTFYIVKPSFVGVHGVIPEFNPGSEGFFTKKSSKFKPESLYEAQLKLRLKKKPTWIEETIKIGNKMFKHWEYELHQYEIYLNTKR